VGARGKVHNARKGFLFICNVVDHALNKENHVFVRCLYCPIRKISVERRGPRVKRFFVSEAQRAELENLTEDRQSGTPGDFSGAGFLVLFYDKKVLRDFHEPGFGMESRYKWIPGQRPL
jgi:hypothetical protein